MNHSKHSVNCLFYHMEWRNDKVSYKIFVLLETPSYVEMYIQSFLLNMILGAIVFKNWWVIGGGLEEEIQSCAA
jgi:hypothetical protein